MNLGELFKQARLERGLTQVELCEAYGVKYSSQVSYLERGVAISFEQAVRVCRALDLDLSDVAAQVVADTPDS